jgi:hypothetical protein
MVLIVGLSIPLFIYQKDFYYKYSTAEISFIKYYNQNFVIAKQFSEDFGKIAKKEDSLLVWAAEPEVYFYLNKKSPIFFHYYYYWMENFFSKNKIKSEILKNPPKYILWTGYHGGLIIPKDIIIKQYRIKKKYDYWVLLERAK